MSGSLASPEAYREIQRREVSGDQEVLTYDTSKRRRGVGYNVPLTSPLAVAAGSALVMEYATHNFAINEQGAYAPRDDTGAVTMWLYDENEIERWFSAPSGSTGTTFSLTQYMSYNHLTGTLTPTNLGGTATNNSAAAGSVGEMGPGSTNSAPTFTTATSANMATISLTAGDWDVWGVGGFILASTTTATQLQLGIGTTSATLPAAGLYGQLAGFTMTGTATVYLDAPTVRVSVASTTTVYLVGNATFATAGLTGAGYLYARRRR